MDLDLDDRQTAARTGPSNAPAPLSKRDKALALLEKEASDIIKRKEALIAKANEAEEIIAKVITTLQNTIQHLEREKEFKPSNTEGMLYAAKRDLRTFTRVAQNLPDNFEFIVYTPKPRSRAEVVALRDDFQTNVKKQLLMKTATEPVASAAFKEMKLTKADIKKLADKGSCKRNKKETHDVTVDHTIDLKDGGTNSDSNLRILAEHVNSLKQTFGSIQERNLPYETRRITFAPKDGVRVPITAGGFKTRIDCLSDKSRGRTIRRRQKQFLGLS